LREYTQEHTGPTQTVKVNDGARRPSFEDLFSRSLGRRVISWISSRLAHTQPPRFLLPPPPATTVRIGRPSLQRAIGTRLAYHWRGGLVRRLGLLILRGHVCEFDHVFGEIRNGSVVSSEVRYPLYKKLEVLATLTAEHSRPLTSAVETPPNPSFLYSLIHHPRGISPLGPLLFLISYFSYYNFLRH
jgi:hypothetical protein